MNPDLLIKDTQPHINITPLIDVLLVLLIIFMVVSPLKPSRFQAAIPQEPANEKIEPNPLALVVTINSDSTLDLNKRGEMGRVDDARKLSAELVQIFKARTENGAFRENLTARGDLSNDEKTEKTVFIKAPRSIAYGDVVKVLDAVKGAGASPVGLQIDDLTD